MKKLVFLISIILLLSSNNNVFSINHFGDEEDLNSTLVPNANHHLTLIKSNGLMLFPVPAPKSVSYPSQGLLFQISPNYSAIYNADINSDDLWNNKGKFGFNIEIGYFIKFHRFLSFGAGLGYSTYSSTISTDSYSQQSDISSDLEGHQVVRYIEVSEFSESLKIGFLDIPIYLEIGNPNIDQIGFYGRLGFKISFPVTTKLDGEGTYTSWGYYPDCPVELRDIPELGYYTNRPVYNSDEEPELKPVSFSLLLSGGITFPLSNYLIFKVGANLNFGLSEISDMKSDEGSDTDITSNYSNLLYNSSKTTIRSYGLEIGIIYNLRLY